MQIIPAVDLKSDKVVRAVAGRRETYRPIESCLAKSAQPNLIGQALVDKLGLRQAYVADLDAIQGAEPSWDLYVSLIRNGLSLWIDAGITEFRRAEQLVDFANDHPEVNGIVGGLESLSGIELLQQCITLAGPERFVFSLDLRENQPLTNAPDWQDMIAPEIAATAVGVGAQRIIAVDLASVGMHGGCGTARLCRLMCQRFPEVQFCAGGGIRGMDDLERLEHAGCYAALVSSALHDGWLNAEHIEHFNDS